MKIGRGILTAVLAAALLLAGCGGAPEPQAQIDAASAFFQALTEGHFDDAYARLSPEAKKEVPSAALLGEIWSGMDAAAGALIAVHGYEAEQLEEGYAVKATVEYALLTGVFVIPMDAQCRIHSIAMVESQASATDAPMPEGVTEEETTITADSRFPLGATITLPAGEGPFPAAVIVQGSGSGTDREGTVGVNKVYQQLARSLAARGIAVLRADKRVYRYASVYQSDEALLRGLTPREEAIDDAVAAVKILEADPRFSGITVLGHSLGGILAPDIVRESGADAMVILAGSPRPLWEILIEQYTRQIEGLRALAEDTAKDEMVRAQYRANADTLQTMVDQLAEVTDSLDRIDDEAAKALLVPLGGSSAYYFKHLKAYDAAAVLTETGKPALILQGEDDIQVSAERDYALWETRLAGYDGATLKLYPGLNHLFMPSLGMTDGGEYNTPAVIDARVLDDIAGFIVGLRR